MIEKSVGLDQGFGDAILRVVVGIGLRQKDVRPIRHGADEVCFVETAWLWALHESRKLVTVVYVTQALEGFEDPSPRNIVLVDGIAVGLRSDCRQNSEGVTF